MRHPSEKITPLRLGSGAVALLERIGDAIVAIDEGAAVTYWNSGAERLYGIAREEAIGKPLASLYTYLWDSPNSERMALDALERVGEWRGKNVHVLKTGERRSVESTVSILRSADGRRAGMVAVIRDVTARTGTTEELLVSAALEAVNQSTAVCVALKDRESRIVYANRNVIDLFARPEPDVYGHNDIDFFGPELGHRIVENDRRVMQTRVSESMEEATPGGRVWLSTKSPWVDARGDILGVIVVAQDITDRKRAEEALRDREERLRAVAENMLDGLVIFDTSGNITYQNPSSVRIHQDRLSGDRCRFEQLVLNWTVRRYPDGSPVAPEHWAIPRILRGERVQNETFFVDCAEQPGRSFVGIYNGSPVHDAQGNIAYGFLTIKDITQQADAEAALRVANERLREADRRKDDFLAMVSHELRNPLAPIRYATQIVARAGPLDESAQRAVRTIERQTDHLTRLVDDLLDVTRIVHGKIALHREPVDVNDVVARVVGDFRAPLHERGIAVTVVLADQKLTVDADPMRLTQAVSNLLQNAAKFTNRGDTVTVTVRSTPGLAEVEVADTGVGIDPSLLPTIFEPFVQGERTLGRSERGLGLGLALVKGLVELHGGSVHAESAGPGKGSRFLVRLPSELVARGATGADTRAMLPRAGRRRILVVDDDHDCADTLAELLRVLGHDVDTAYDATTAIEKVRAHPPNSVLCDIGMPEIGGDQLLVALRAIAPNTMRIIAVTGRAQPEDVRKAMAAGFDAHVAKPADITQIERLLE